MYNAEHPHRKPAEHHNKHAGSTIAWLTLVCEMLTVAKLYFIEMSSLYGGSAWNFYLNKGMSFG